MLEIAKKLNEWKKTIIIKKKRILKTLAKKLNVAKKDLRKINPPLAHYLFNWQKKTFSRSWYCEHK